MLDFKSLWDKGQTFQAFVSSSAQHKALWQGIYRIARLPQWAISAVPIGTRRRPPSSLTAWAPARTRAAALRTVSSAERW